MKSLLFLFLSANMIVAAVVDEPVEDRRVKDTLRKFSGAEMDAGRTVKADALGAQRSRRRCQAELLPVVTQSESLANLRCKGTSFSPLPLSADGPVFDDRCNFVAVVANTDTVYYTEESGQPKNVQMVFKNCVSARSILALIAPKPLK